MSLERFTGYQVLTQDEWNRFYTKETYDESPLQTMLIDENICVEKIHQKIDFFVFINPQLLAKPDSTPMKFTPLHVAVITGRKHIAEKILEALKKTGLLKEAIEMTDAHYFRAIHHAAPRKKMADLLLKYGADPTAKTPMNGTLQSYSRMTTEKLDHRELKGEICSIDYVSFREKGVTTSISKLIDNGTLENKTGIKDFRDGLYVNEESWKNLWLYPSESINDSGFGKKLVFESELTEWYDAYKKSGHKAKLVIQKSPALEKVSQLSLGVFAGEFLSFKLIIGSYGAKVIGDSEAKQLSSFRTKFIDAKFTANALSRINAGFPNVYSQVQFYDGFLAPIYFVSEPDGIKEGEELLANYGFDYSYSAYTKPFIILGEERMMSFFAKGIEPISHQMDIFSKNLPKELMNCNFLADKLLYPLAFPTALIKLHLTGIVPIQIWYNAITNFESESSESDSNIGIGLTLLKRNQDNYDKLMTLVNLITSFENMLEGKKELKKVIYKFIETLCSKYSVMHIAKFMDEIFKILKFKDMAMSDWPSTKEKFMLLMDNYEPESDDTNPLHKAAIYVRKELNKLESSVDLSKLFEGLKVNPKIKSFSL